MQQREPKLKQQPFGYPVTRKQPLSQQPSPPAQQPTQRNSTQWQVSHS
jgi:hypothetical protein